LTKDVSTSFGSCQT